MNFQTKNIILILFGWLFFIIGFIGIFLPILPTTPFMILAAAFFSRGSPRLHAWLLRQKKIGPAIELWEQHRIIPVKAKVFSTILILSSLIFPIFVLKVPRWGIIGMILVLSLVLFFIWRQKSELN